MTPFSPVFELFLVSPSITNVLMQQQENMLNQQWLNTYGIVRFWQETKGKEAGFL